MAILNKVIRIVWKDPMSASNFTKVRSVIDTNDLKASKVFFFQMETEQGTLQDVIIPMSSLERISIEDGDEKDAP